MLIDWFTVMVQILNFLVLILLLKKFLYKPILTMMAEREAKIAEELASAASVKEEAEKEKISFEDKNRQLKEQEQDLLKQARETAQNDYKVTVEKLRQEIETKKIQWYQKLEKDKEVFLSELESKTQEEIFAILNRLLVDLADSSLEEQIINVFIKKFKELPEEKINGIVALISGTEAEIVVASVFPLTAEQQKSLREILKQRFLDTSKVIFKIDQEIIGGLELSVGGQKLAWSIENYLRMLHKNVENVLEMRQKNDN